MWNTESGGVETRLAATAAEGQVAPLAGWPRTSPAPAGHLSMFRSPTYHGCCLSLNVTHAVCLCVCLCVTLLTRMAHRDSRVCTSGCGITSVRVRVFCCRAGERRPDLCPADRQHTRLPVCAALHQRTPPAHRSPAAPGAKTAQRRRAAAPPPPRHRVLVLSRPSSPIQSVCSLAVQPVDGCMLMTRPGRACGRAPPRPV